MREVVKGSSAKEMSSAGYMYRDARETIISRTNKARRDSNNRKLSSMYNRKYRERTVDLID